MRIKIKNPGGKEKCVIFEENTTIKEAKQISGSIGYTWKFNGEVLKEDKTLSYYDIEEDDTIIENKLVKGGGGFGLNSIDVSYNNTRIVEFDKNAPYYRMVGGGLSIQAICSNDCEAKNDIVYSHIGYVNNYDILTNLENIKCPACSNPIYPKNFGFLRCKYRIDFTKWKNNKSISSFVEGDADDKFKLFSEYSGNANFTKLVFNVTHK